MPQWYLSTEGALWDQTTKFQPIPPSQGDKLFQFLFGFPFSHGRKKKKKGWEAGGYDSRASADKEAKGTSSEGWADSATPLRSAALPTGFHTISGSTTLTAHPKQDKHHWSHPQKRKSRSLRPPPRDLITENHSTPPNDCQSPTSRGDASSECEAYVPPPTYHMEDASLSHFASLTPFHFSIPLPSSFLLQNTVYFGRGMRGHRSRDHFWTHQMVSLSHINIRTSKPGHNKLRQNGNQHKIVSERQLIFCVQAVPLMYSNTVSALTLLDWQQNWITLQISLSQLVIRFFNPTSSTSLAELQLLYFFQLSWLRDFNLFSHELTSLC